MMNKNNIKLTNRLMPVVMMVLAALLPPVMCAQEPVSVPVPVLVEISKQKIVSEGKVYYMHEVEKGQTLYSISKAYSVTVDQLSRENAIEANGIKEGQVLRVPASGLSQAGTNSQVSKPQGTPGTQTSTRAVTVQPGSRTPVQAVPSPQKQDERFLYHPVKRGETPASIAYSYGISVRDLKRANKGMLFPKEGDVLMIPRKKISGQREERAQVPVADIAAADTLLADTVAVTEEPEIFTVTDSRTEISRLSGTVKVAVLLPFFINENNSRSEIDSSRKDAQGNKVYREVNKSGGWIYEGSLPFIETYEGILLAVDSLRALGLTVELDVFDTAADSARINRLLWSDALDNMDLIIGPVYSYNLEKVSSWAAGRNIPVVSPVALRDPQILENRPTLYRVFPSESVAQDIMAGELREHRGSNVVFLHGDSAMYNPATSVLWEKVRNVMAEQGQADSTSLTPFWFTGLTSRWNAYSGVTSIDNLLDPERENVIVIGSTSTPVVSSTLSTLHSLSRKYKIKVIGYPEIGGLETVDLRYYYDLELFIPAGSYIDFSSPASKSFMSAFMRKFRTEPMAESFAWRGFDIAWFFIGGIATGGDDFLRDPGIFNPALLCLDPDFRRESRMNGYENRGMFVMHYRKDMTIEVKRPRKQPGQEEKTEQFPVGYPFTSGSSGRNRGR